MITSGRGEAQEKSHNWNHYNNNNITNDSSDLIATKDYRRRSFETKLRN